MELRHLRYFAAVAKHLSFSKAAEELHISQPPLSRQIQELERELGAGLFVRKAKRIELTKAGDYLLVEALRILDSVEMVAHTVKVLGQAQASSLRIGCVNFLMYATLPPFFEIFREKEPGIKLELSVMSTEAQERAIRSGAIDVGFVRSWEGEEGLVFEPLSEERLAIIFPSAAEIDRDPGRCIAGLRDSAFVAISSATAPGLAEKVKSVCEEYGCVPNVGYTCSDAYSIIKLVSTGLGWSIVPDMAYRDAAIEGVGIVMLPQTMVLGLCYGKTILSEQEARFIELAKAFFSDRARLAGATARAAGATAGP
jgi:LysR family transcriptional regulator, benzoate and cis,cis-muconate-responsive activator of ben and cat genes